METLIRHSHSLPRESFSVGAFCAAETARLVHDWSTDGQVRPLGSQGFHRGFIRPAVDRRATRLRCMGLTRDLVCYLYLNFLSCALLTFRNDQSTALDGTCAVGTITFHMFAELPPNTGARTISPEMMADNLSVFISDSLIDNVAVAPALEEMEKIVRDAILVPFAQDWRHRAVASVIYQRIEWYWRLLLRPSVSTQVLVLPAQCYHHQRRLYHLIIPLALLSRPPLVVETLHIRPCRPGRHQLPPLRIYFQTSLL